MTDWIDSKQRFNRAVRQAAQKVRAKGHSPYTWDAFAEWFSAFRESLVDGGEMPPQVLEALRVESTNAVIFCRDKAARRKPAVPAFRTV